MQDRMARRVALLLEDARWAREHGEPGEVRALATAVLALDPGNAEAEGLLAEPEPEPEPGVAAFFAGRFPEARELLPARDAHLALALWITGDPEGARAVAEPEAACVIARLEGDHARALGHARDVGERRAIHEGLSRVRLGDPVALDDLEAAVAQATGRWSAWFLTELAGAQAHAGRRTAAYESLEAALALGAGFVTAEALRLRGELRCEDGDEDGLEDLRAAVETARRQGATAFEARAVASLRAAEAYAA
jgi:hypothetical protein